MTTAPTPPKTEDPTTKEPDPAWWERPIALALAGAATFGALVAWGTWSVAKWDERKIAEAGAFGDSFAPIVGLVSAAALCAAVVSVFIQRRELALQRIELRATRKEMEAQRLATEAQAAEVKRANDLTERANAIAARGQWIAIHQALIANDQGAIHSTREEVRDRAKALQRVLLDVIKDMPRD
jgi:hypothetical protein